MIIPKFIRVLRLKERRAAVAGEQLRREAALDQNRSTATPHSNTDPGDDAPSRARREPRQPGQAQRQDRPDGDAQKPDQGGDLQIERSAETEQNRLPRAWPTGREPAGGDVTRR